MSEPTPSDPNPTGMPLPEAIAAQFQDSLRWMSQLWTQGPAAMAAWNPPPAADLADLDKRLGELRGVERWLDWNLNAVRLTIQAWEAQRAAAAAWRGVQAGKPTAVSGVGGGEPPPAGTPPFDATAWWAALERQFQFMAEQAGIKKP